MSAEPWPDLDRLENPVWPEIAATTSKRQVRGEDIAKTTARRATEEERWRYGVELRILGSRWRPQKPAPHYPTPAPYVYRKTVHSLAWCASDHNRHIDEDYLAWLAERDAPKPAQAPIAIVKPEEPPMPEAEIVPLRSVPDERERREAAAALLRDIAAQYGPRRAHKLRAMADFLVAERAPARQSA